MTISDSEPLASLSAMTNRDAERSRGDATATSEALPKHATFDQVCEVAVPRLYGFIRAQVANRELAKDLLGRVVLKAANRWAGQRCSEATMHWMFRTARTTVIDHWRVEGRAERVQVPLDELREPISTSNTPEQTYAAKERQALLLTAMSDLDKEDRSLLALKFAGQRTNRQIARILSVSEGVVSMRLLRALRKLRQRLDHMGVA